MLDVLARIVQELVVAGDVTLVVTLEGQTASETAKVDGSARCEFRVVSAISAAHCDFVCAGKSEYTGCSGGILLVAVW